MPIGPVYEFEWKRLARLLDEKLKYIGNRVDLGQFISPVVYRDIIDHFAKEEGPKGKWKKWSISYAGAINGRVAFRYINGRVVPLGPYAIEEYGIKPPRKPGKILQATGRLRQSITPGSWKQESEGFKFFNNAQTKDGFPYAKAHDEGGPRLPQRKFMYLSRDGMGKVKSVAIRWLKEQFE